MTEGRMAPTTSAAQVGEVGLLDQILDQGRLAKDASSKERAKDLIWRFVSEILEGSIIVRSDIEAMLNDRIAQLDYLISFQLDEVMHAPELQSLEATWRGLKYLLSQTETSMMLKVKVLNVSKKELLRDLQRAPEFDQSSLFKKVYEDVYSVFGGAPFGMLLGDYEFSKSGEDIELLEKVSQVAATAHAPFIAAARAEMFNLPSFAQLDAPRDLSTTFEVTAYAKWNAFRATEDSRYVALTVPHILLRKPYGSHTVPVESFQYEERIDATEHGKYLWGNSAWALGAVVMRAFTSYAWCACIRGVDGGGLVQDLPIHNFRSDSGDVAMKCPTEMPISDRRQKELVDLGFTPLVHCKGTPYAAFFTVQSAQKPKVYDREVATASARITTQLPCIFAVSRFAHYLKAITRDRVGRHMSRSEAQTALNTWIVDYVASSDDATLTVKAKRPLIAGRVEVQEDPRRRSVYRAVAFLRPHFQLDELSVSIRLVTDLPEPVR